MPGSKIGITTSVPVEVLLAAGLTPVDLNNLFIGAADPGRFIRLAERHGFPINTCAWIKGIYGVCLEEDIRTVLGVTTGDCSNTLMLLEVLKMKGLETIPFAYPAEADMAGMNLALKMLAARLGASLEEAEKIRRQLLPARRLAEELDRLTWQENRASGLENHSWLVSSSDFDRDVRGYAAALEALVAECRARQPFPKGELRLAYIGVPSMFGRELYPFLEENGARVVLNEIQRQFSMPGSPAGLAEQYSSYTYPYAIEGRIRDIDSQCRLRGVDGIIHYVQAFCHRGIADIIFRRRLGYPVLTIEGNTECGLSQHLKTRLEAFLDMLGQIKRAHGAEPAHTIVRK
jgi:benzoyl-CoA reductase/2-hydroxyglutaryl-CoA dehydratase subunit BcrC/BadD/HgdB